MAKFLPLFAVLGAAVVVLFLVKSAYAGEQQPPPEGYPCPYCPGDVTFATYEELIEHVQTEHPGQRIPLPIEWE